MECQFEGVFTDEERRRIHEALERISAVIARQVGEGEAHWHVREVIGAPRAPEYYAQHAESQIEFWGNSVEGLVGHIDQTANILEGSG